MRILLILAGLAVSLAAASQEIYRWVDKNGIVHYSDQPDSPNAELINVIEPNAYEARATRRRTAGVDSATPTEPDDGAVGFALRIALDRLADAGRGVLRFGRGRERCRPTCRARCGPITRWCSS